MRGFQTGFKRGEVRGERASSSCFFLLPEAGPHGGSSVVPERQHSSTSTPSAKTSHIASVNLPAHGIAKRSPTAGQPPSNILKDPEATANDKFVALQFLNNANIAGRLLFKVGIFDIFWLNFFSRPLFVCPLGSPRGGIPPSLKKSLIASQLVLPGCQAQGPTIQRVASRCGS